MKNFIITLGFLLITSPVSFSAEKSYQVVPNTDGSASASFLIGYTLGTHNGFAHGVSGNVQLQEAPFMISNAVFSVPITKINTENLKRNCHLQESLGLDYALSVYPESHVCDSENSLPLTGSNAIVYPEIKFNLTSLLDAQANDPLVPGSIKSVIASGTLNLHGVIKVIQVPLTLMLSTTSPATLKVKGQFDLSISDFGIIVRKVLFVTVKDVASVNLDITLQEK